MAKPNKPTSDLRIEKKQQETTQQKRKPSSLLHSLHRIQVNYVVANVDGTPAWIFARLIGSFPKRAIDLLVANVMDIDLNALSSSSD